MAFKCGTCGFVIESRQYTAVEVHKLTHIIIAFSQKLESLGLLPESKEDNTPNEKLLGQSS